MFRSILNRWKSLSRRNKVLVAGIIAALAVIGSFTEDPATTFNTDATTTTVSLSDCASVGVAYKAIQVELIDHVARLRGRGMTQDAIAVDADTVAYNDRLRELNDAATTCGDPSASPCGKLMEKLSEADFILDMYARSPGKAGNAREQRDKWAADRDSIARQMRAKGCGGATDRASAPATSKG